MIDRRTQRMLYGHVDLRSPWFSNRWRLYQDDTPLVELRRLGRIHVSTATLPNGDRWLIEPHGTGVVRALDHNGVEFARIVRRSWLGRRWDVTSQAYAYELVSHPRPRRWMIQIGGADAAVISGSLISYNRVRINAIVAVPMSAVLLAWHVIARPWEAAAEPRGLVPAPRPAEAAPPDPRRGIV
jgi:hypothetical protein